MLILEAGSRPRPSRRAGPGIGPAAEALESRRLLASSIINVASGVTFAPGLPVAGLAIGIGLASTTPTLPTVSVSVSPTPTPPPAPAVPSPTGPAPTLSPLMSDSETANATASEVARPTPGRTDRISNILPTPQIVLLPHINEPEPAKALPDPQAPPAPQVEPAAPPRPAEATRPVDAVPPPAPMPSPAPVEPAPPPLALRAWDEALALVAPAEEDAPASPIDRAEGAMALGALLAAWGGWKYAPRLAGRSRRRPEPIAAA